MALFREWELAPGSRGNQRRRRTGSPPSAEVRGQRETCRTFSFKKKTKERKTPSQPWICLQLPPPRLLKKRLWRSHKSCYCEKKPPDTDIKIYKYSNWWHFFIVIDLCAKLHLRPSKNSGRKSWSLFFFFAALLAVFWRHESSCVAAPRLISGTLMMCTEHFWTALARSQVSSLVLGSRCRHSASRGVVLFRPWGWFFSFMYFQSLQPIRTPPPDVILLPPPLLLAEAF